jgi:hypothetical protein
MHLVNHLSGCVDDFPTLLRFIGWRACLPPTGFQSIFVGNVVFSRRRNHPGTRKPHGINVPRQLDPEEIPARPLKNILHLGSDGIGVCSTFSLSDEMRHPPLLSRHGPRDSARLDPAGSGAIRSCRKSARPPASGLLRREPCPPPPSGPGSSIPCAKCLALRTTRNHKAKQAPIGTAQDLLTPP